MTLHALAAVLADVAEAFVECDGCFGVFDPEYEEVVRGEILLCETCNEEARESWRANLSDLD